MIIRLPIGLLGSNCYLVFDQDGGQGTIVDPGFREEQRLMTEIDTHRLTIRYVLNTHGHFDHIAGNGRLKVPNAQFGIHAADRRLLQSGGGSAGLGLDLTAPPAPDLSLADTMQIECGALTISVLHTPGHTPGSVSFYIADEDAVLTGDTLFAGSVGRTDLLGGSPEDLRRSLARLLDLPKDTRIFPGHGPTSTLAYELADQHNPWLQEYGLTRRADKTS